MKLLLITFLTVSIFVCYGQDKRYKDSLQHGYNAEMKVLGRSFSEIYYPNRQVIYSLNERQFLKKIESLRQPFIDVVNKYNSAIRHFNKQFSANEQRDINYFFERLVIDYPYFHENYTGEKVQLSGVTQNKLDRHLNDFNNPEILVSRDFKSYVEAFLRHRSSIEVKKEIYKTSNNKRLDAYLDLIPKYFTNQECRDHWQYHYLLTHLDEWGSKNIGKAVASFLATSQNKDYTRSIDSIYKQSVDSYQGHLIKTYKTVDGHKLDLHIFLPDITYQRTKRPVMVYFSGGSWTKGTPEWDFYNCANYAKKGWIAVAVEYRVADRFESTPFEAVKDARSAIRWLRLNADSYNLDTHHIVATGNSAGGHLVLTTALANEWNEKTDDLHVSASPNLLLVNAGVYNLYANESTAWITSRLKDRSLAKKISPQHLLRKDIPPMLIIHGTSDQSVDYVTAKAFAEEMKKLGNDFEFHTIEEAPHYIWYDRRFSGKVANIRNSFLRKYGYD